MSGVLSTEVEVRCRVKHPEKFLKILKGLDAAFVFPAKRGEVEEYNLIYKKPCADGNIARLRMRTFADGTHTYVYTEKGPNAKGNSFQQKKESNVPLKTRALFKEKLSELEERYKRIAVYERRFRADQYRVFQGVSIELFEFPIGYYAEFELKHVSDGIDEGINILKKVLALFKLGLRDNIGCGVSVLAKKFCRENGIPFSPVIVFSDKKWKVFADEYGVAYVRPIDISEKPPYRL